MTKTKGLSRNDPCWCGSEKKYKKCHLGKDAQKGSGRDRKKNPLVLDEHERDGMRAAGRFNAQLMDYIRDKVQPGVTTRQIDQWVHEYTLDHGQIPACLGYKGFPRSCCTSVNEVVCHGIPDETTLKDGDIVNIDLTTIVDGWHGDSSETFLIGEVSEEARRVTQCSFECLYIGIRAIKPRGKIIDIGKAIKAHADKFGFSVVREYQGHGIGRIFHQEPSIPHFPELRLYNRTVEPGVCFTIEPMINLGTWRTMLDPTDKWTVRTLDRKLSAQFEHTLLMTEDGPEILTMTQRGPSEGFRF